MDIKVSKIRKSGLEQILPDIHPSFLKMLGVFENNELIKFQESVNSITKSCEPALQAIEQARSSFVPVLPIIQSALKQQEILYQALRPQKTYFIPPRVIVPHEPALSHSDIPYITDAVVNKLTLRMKLAKKIKKGSGQITILFQDHTLFLPNNPGEKYVLRSAPKRLEMLVLLINAGNEFTSTSDIRKYAGSASNETVRKELKALDHKICDALGLSKDIIECIPGVGYRINTLYRIKIINK